jgi:SET domain-containing protein
MDKTTTNKETIVDISKLQGKGLFALKDFKKGEIVLNWNSDNKYLSKDEVENLPDDQKRYIAVHNGRYLLIAEPERYMNHSCDPNTQNKIGIDYALKDISKGEEITGDYENEGTLVGFACNCGSKNCRKVIHPRSIEIYA